MCPDDDLAPEALTAVPEGFRYCFQAMASPCEVRVDTSDPDLARDLGRRAEAEVRRIEAKFSRYREDSQLSAINRSAGASITVDSETAALLNYAQHCFQLSGGRFDITSGVLRRLWRFDGSDNLPTKAEVRRLLPFIGWRRVSWDGSVLELPKGMELDLGGIGKEYAVDRAILAITGVSDCPSLVNLGGDLRVTGPRRGGERWRVAIESVDRARLTDGLLALAHGALTTSGDARRFLLKNGRRYSHILDPRTGWPVVDPPRSVTVAAPTCLEAGLLSTLAMLQGRHAERFLRTEGISAWWVR